MTNYKYHTFLPDISYIKKTEKIPVAEIIKAEKIKLDLEFLIDELVDNINSEKPKTQLLRNVKKIKSTLTHA